MSYNYLKTPLSVANRAGLGDMRLQIDEDHVLLSESDFRMIDLTLEEKAGALGCQIISEEEALKMINGNSEDGQETEETNPENTQDNNPANDQKGGTV